MGHAAGRRHSPHIDEQAHAMVVKQLDELIERSGGVPDRQD
jgi:hypothetical protein